MTEAALLKIIVVGQTGLFLLVTLVLWHKLDALRQALLCLRHPVGLRGDLCEPAPRLDAAARAATRQRSPQDPTPALHKRR
jgi:hypothetical protein